MYDFLHKNFLYAHLSLRQKKNHKLAKDYLSAIPKVQVSKSTKEKKVDSSVSTFFI